MAPLFCPLFSFCASFSENESSPEVDCFCSTPFESTIFFPVDKRDDDDDDDNDSDDDDNDDDNDDDDDTNASFRLIGFFIKKCFTGGGQKKQK